MQAKFDSAKLRKARLERGISQSVLAENADTTIRYIRDLESGAKDNPSAVLLYQMSAALGVPMEEFMAVVEEE